MIGLFVAMNALTEREMDLLRARQQRPRPHFRGVGEGHSAEVINQLLMRRYGSAMLPCEEWNAAELQALQMKLWELRSTELESIYANQTVPPGKRDRRAIGSSISELQARWTALDAIADSGLEIEQLRRDGHCYEAAMWLTHHLPQSAQDALARERPLPLLPQGQRHSEAFQRECGGSRSGEVCASIVDQKNW